MKKFLMLPGYSETTSLDMINTRQFLYDTDDSQNLHRKYVFFDKVKKGHIV